jgi:hypothetical protein
LKVQDSCALQRLILLSLFDFVLPPHLFCAFSACLRCAAAILAEMKFSRRMVVILTALLVNRQLLLDELSEDELAVQRRIATKQAKHGPGRGHAARRARPRKFDAIDVYSQLQPRKLSSSAFSDDNTTTAEGLAEAAQTQKSKALEMATEK